MQAWLEYDDLWGCIIGTEEYVSDTVKVTKAKSKLILSVDPVNYVHIQDCTTAKEVWEKLQVAFEDSGLTRKVGLLKTLVTTQLEKCKDVDEYVNIIIITADKLTGVGFKVPDEWVGTLLLAGLPDENRPIIMDLGNSGTAITADSIKTELIQDVKCTKNARNTSRNRALYTKGAKTKSKLTVLSV